MKSKLQSSYNRNGDYFSPYYLFFLKKIHFFDTSLHYVICMSKSCNYMREECTLYWHSFISNYFFYYATENSTRFYSCLYLKIQFNNNFYEYLFLNIYTISIQYCVWFYVTIIYVLIMLFEMKIYWFCFNVDETQYQIITFFHACCCYCL